MQRYFYIIIVFLLVFQSCKQEFTPKPRGYFRIDLPEKKYKESVDRLPYKFEYPEYADLVKDSTVDSSKKWMNLMFRRYNATLHLSYNEVGKDIDRLTEETRSLAYKHTIKAESISEQVFQKQEANVFGILYRIEGNAASSIQFYMTDSSKHFLRGALYFNNKPNKDSLAPVINFISKDVLHLIETLSWE